MTEFTIRYYKYDPNFGECEVKIPTHTLNEFLLHFNRLFERELLQGQFKKEQENTHIKFQASKKKIQLLEKVIHIARASTARLN